VKAFQVECAAGGALDLEPLAVIAASSNGFDHQLIDDEVT
jgi:hypothetical protein